MNPQTCTQNYSYTQNTSYMMDEQQHEWVLAKYYVDYLGIEASFSHLHGYLTETYLCHLEA